MNLRIRQWIAAVLFLGICLAGVVSINPVLHVAIEHGGKGSVHTHHGVTSARPHSHPHLHSQPPCAAPGSLRALARTEPADVFVSTHLAFSLPSLSAHEFWSALREFLGQISSGEGADPDPSRDGDTPDHAHHSLSQLMADGLIDHSDDAPLFQVYFLKLDHLALPVPSDPRIVRQFDTQTAGRAPPPGWS